MFQFRLFLSRRPKINEELKIETSDHDQFNSKAYHNLNQPPPPPKLNFVFSNEYDPIGEHLNRLGNSNTNKFRCGANNRSRSIPNRVERDLNMDNYNKSTNTTTTTTDNEIGYLMERPSNVPI